MTRKRQMDQEPTLFDAKAPANATVTTTSGEIVASNATRAFLTMFNLDASEGIFLGLDGNAAVLSKGIPIPAGGAYVFDRASMSIGSVAAICAAGTVTVSIQEGD